MRSVGMSVEEREGTGFNAFTRRGIGRRVRIVERAVRGEARGLARVGIENLEHERFVAIHLREPEPAMTRIVSDVIDLAGAVLVAALDTYEAFIRNAAPIADAQRIDHHGTANRTPDLDDGPSFLHAALGFRVAYDLPQPHGCRALGVIVVHAFDRGAGAGHSLRVVIGETDRVIEHDDAGCAGVLHDERLDLRVVDALAFRFVGEVPDLRPVIDEDEAVHVEPERIAQRTAVLYRHLAQFVLRRPRVVLHLRPVYVADGGLRARNDVVEFRADGVGGRLLDC